MEWGASAYALSFLADLANNVSAEAVVGGMAYAVGKIRGKKRRPIAGTPRSGPADDVHVTQRTVEAVFDERDDDIAAEESLVVGRALAHRSQRNQWRVRRHAYLALGLRRSHLPCGARQRQEVSG